MTTRRYQLPEQQRDLSDARDRIEALEFGNAVPTMRGAIERALADRQTVPSGSTPVTLEWDYVELTDLLYFTRQPVTTPPTPCVVLSAHAVYLLKTKLCWATTNWNGTAEITINGDVCFGGPPGDTLPLWSFNDRATFTHVSSLPTDAGDVFTTILSVYHFDPLNSLIPPDTPVDLDLAALATFTIEVRQNSGVDQDISETGSRFELYYLGGLGVRSPTQPASS